LPRSKAPPRIAVIDAETDPFLYGRVPKPFAWGFYDGETYTHFWGDGATRALVDFLDRLKGDWIIYAHNGGKFDFYFLIDYIENPIRVIGSRIVSCKIGRHEFRDSYAAIPIPLGAYQKTSIDYQKFEIENREANKTEILDYLKDDCVFLHSLISSFIARFDTALTIGGAAMKTLKSIHKVTPRNQSHDAKYRPFYFGGRVQCFKYGVFDGPVKIYDVNSMYPAVMRNEHHPTGARYLNIRGGIADKRGEIAGMVGAKFYFAHVHATVSGGGLPIREKMGLNFSQKTGEFFTTSHEMRLLCQLGLMKVHKVIFAAAPYETVSFVDYVDKFSAEKIDAKTRGDKAGEIFAKLLLNSAYGKFAQNPENYKEWMIARDEEIPEAPFQLEKISDGYQLWSKPTEAHNYHDVATAASITSAARATLLKGLLSAKGAIYCDTDSIICEEMGEGADIDSKRLGAWKLEGEGVRTAVAGKKLYAVFDASGECIKKAAKGAIFSGDEIRRLSMGETLRWKNDAPTFSLQKKASFIDRSIARTQNLF